MQPFVKQTDNKTYGEPKLLWESHSFNAPMPKNSKDYNEFFENASTAIRERNKLITNEYRDKLSKVLE